MPNRETSTVQQPAMLAVGARPDVLVWRQQSGVFRAYDDPRRIVRVGLPGMADIGGVVAVTITPDMVGRTIGVALQAECKTLNGRVAQSQNDWRAAVQRRGGVYDLIRSEADMVALVERIQTGRW